MSLFINCCIDNPSFELKIIYKNSIHFLPNIPLHPRQDKTHIKRLLFANLIYSPYLYIQYTKNVIDITNSLLMAYKCGIPLLS